MSERWFARSTVFNANLSFNDSSTFNERVGDRQRQLKVLNILPILNWPEKLLIVIDFCQLFALLWIMAQPWPWPFLWSEYTQHLVYFNIDIFSMSPNGALVGRSSSINTKWGFMNNYPEYAVKFAAAQAFLFWSIIFFRTKYKEYGEITPESRHRIIGVLVLISYIIYIPCSLATFRLYDCDSEQNVLSADPSLDCFGPKHSIYFAVCTILTMPVFVGLPYMLHRYVRQAVIYKQSVDHEKRLQIWELLQMLKLDDFWLKKQLWITSSFNLCATHFRVHIMMFKAWYLILFIFFRFNMRVQSVLCVVTTGMFCAYYSFGLFTDWATLLPFRSFTSNLVLLCTFAMLITNCTFGMVNQFGVHNAMTVGSTEFYFLWTFCLVCIIFIGVVCLLDVALYKASNWPSVQTLHRICHNEDLVSKVSLWVTTMRESFIVRADFMLAPVEVADVESLEECIRILRSCWLSARNIGSIFEVPLSELLEELLYIHACRYPEALRRHPYWNAEYVKPDVRAALQKRYYEHNLMPARKRRILFKLLAIRFLKADRGEFSMDVALRQAKEMEEDLAVKEEKEKELLALLERRKLQMSESSKNSKGFAFANFSVNAQFLLFGSMPEEDEGKGVDSDLQRLLKMESGKQEGDNEKEDEHRSVKHFDDFGQEIEEEKTFSPNDVEEAVKMIARLIERSELALNKHHNAKKNMIAQENKALADAIALNGSSVASTSAATGGVGLSKISTMELIKETVDVEERKDLEELYFLWDEAIQLYEVEEFPGDYEKLNKEAENWYTYRNLVTQRLEVVARTLQERDYESLIEGQEVIEEGDESDEESDDGKTSKGGGASVNEDTSARGKRRSSGPQISPRLQQLQKLSSIVSMNSSRPQKDKNSREESDDDLLGFGQIV